MSVQQLRPKKDPNVPDFFEVKVTFINGRKKVIKAVNRTLVNCQIIPNPTTGREPIVLPLNGNTYWEFLNTDNLYVQVPIASIEDIEYDINFTNMVEAAQARRDPTIKKQVPKQQPETPSTEKDSEGSEEIV